jgi:hypothetical protein
MKRDDRVVVRDGVMFNRVGEEIVLLDLDSGTYFGLDSVGSRVWELVTGNATIGEAIDAMLDEYEVEREVLERDVLLLVAELEEKQLIRLSSRA